MSLTSYRAAPPRVEGFVWVEVWLAGARGLGARGFGPVGRGVLPARTWFCRRRLCRRRRGGFGGPGGDLLFHALRRSTIGAEGFHGRVRDGIGCFAPRYGHQAGQDRRSEIGWQRSEIRISSGLWSVISGVASQHVGRQAERGCAEPGALQWRPQVLCGPAGSELWGVSSGEGFATPVVISDL